MLAIDNTANVQPLPRVNYVDVCTVEDNPWRSLFHSGTAGATSDLFCVERLSNGASYQFLRLECRSAQNTSAPESDIDTLIALLKPSMSQLASAFGVSRQRVYDWRGGAGMSRENQEQMSALLTAARMLSERHSSPQARIANRKLSGGKSFWDAIASGMSPQDAATSVLRVIERDENERSALKHSLASRKFVAVKEEPLFAAHLSE